MKKTIVSMIVLATSVFLLPLSSEAAQLNFYDIDTLSSQEQEAIIKEKPSISSEYEQYTMVYQKDSAGTRTDEHTDLGGSFGQGNSGKALKSTTQSALPKAGELDHANLLLYGSGIIAISLFALYKRKKYSKLLLVILIPASLGTRSLTVLAAGESLIPTETISLSKGEVKSIEPNVIEGYTYVGYFPVGQTNPPKGDSTIIVRYVDGYNNELHGAQIITGTIGENYDASTEKYVLAIPGYTLNEAKLPVNATGMFEEKEQTVTYEYEKEADKEGTVTIHYLNTDGVAIMPPDSLSGEIGQAFHVEKKEIPNFLFKHAEGEFDGVFSLGETTIKLYYTDEVKINIHYINKSTKEPLMLNSLNYYADYLRPDLSDIDDYYYTSSYNGKTYSSGSVVSSDQVTVKVGTEYILPKEIRFLITKPDGQTMDSFTFPKVIVTSDGGWIAGIDSYSNYLFFSERPEYIPENYKGTADQLEINVTYELTYITNAIPEP